MSYRIEKLNSENIGDLCFIYKHAFKNEISVDLLEKKHNTSKFGASYLGFIAYSATNEPAAFYGAFACEIAYKGKKYLAAQSGDTMTHPNHTKKGLFTKLALQTYVYCKEIGVHLVFGFPNQNSYPGFVKRLSWIHFDDLQAYHIRVKTLPWVRLKNTFNIGQYKHDNYCRKIIQNYKKGSPFLSSCYEENVPVVDHSTTFFSYKNLKKSSLVKLAGVSVWLKTSAMFLQVGDLERCSEDTFKQVIKELKQMAFFMGIPHLRFHCSTNSWLESKLKKTAEKMDNTYAVGGVNFTNIIPMEKLQFTMGDNDTF